MRNSGRVSVALALALLAPSSVLAATLQVGGGGQYSTIQSAIDAAVAGDVVNVAAGTYNGSIDLRGKAITLKSLSGRAATTLNGNGTYNGIIMVNGVGAGATIEGFTIQNVGQRAVLLENAKLTLRDVEIKNSGNIYLLGGAIQQKSGTLTVDNALFTNNDSCGGTDLYAYSGAAATFSNTVHNDGYGYFGGVAQTIDTTLTLTNVEMNRTLSDLDGGAVHMNNTDAVFTDVVIDSASNAYGHGGAVAVVGGSTLTWTGGAVTNTSPQNTYGYYGAVYVSGSSALTVEGVEFAGNTGGNGAALAVVDGSTATVTDSEFVDNDGVYGGAVLFEDNVVAVIDGVVFSGNEAEWDGGAIEAKYDVDLTVSNSTFTGNEATSGYGGAVRIAYGCSADFDDASFVGNIGATGGGVNAYDCGETVSFDSVTFENNVATAATGGGLYVAGATDATVADSSFVGNTSVGSGGGAFFEGGWSDGDDADATITNSTFDQNTSSDDHGGGVYAGIRAYLTVEDSQFSQNQADGYGGGIVKDYDGDLTVRRSVLANNSADSDGGGVYVYSTLYGASTANVIIEDSEFSANASLDDGGGMAILCSVQSDVTGNRFVQNVATDQGGGFYLYYMGGQKVEANYVCGNTAKNGGGAYSTNYYPAEDAWLDNWMVENTATSNGGGIYLSGAYSATFTGTSAVGNAAALGGGVYLSSSYVDFDGGEFAYNDAGNGVHAKDNNSNLNSTFANANFYANTPAHVGGYFAANKIVGNGNTETQPVLPVQLDSACDDDPWGGPCPGAPSTDTDGDGMPDACDVCPAGSDVVDSDGDTVADGCDACPAGADNLDLDIDGVPDACDVCPADPADDSDGDGACDGDDECPFDADKFAEGVCGCHSDDVDSDGDTVIDCMDSCSGGDDRLDWDADGMADACDVCVGGDDSVDSDGDNVPDFCDDLGGSPCGDGIEPLPCNPWGDTDGDGLGDTAEINAYYTDMFDPDTDGDGLLDGDEVILHGTLPTDSDTDGDAALDGAEILAGTDPLVADVIPALDVNRPTPGVSGTVNTYSLSGGTPGEKVIFFMSTKTGSTDVYGCDDATLDMASPATVGSATVGDDGTAKVVRFVGVAASGKEYRIQAVEKDTCRVSDVELETF